MALRPVNCVRVVLLTLLGAGCSGESTTPCTVGADCASGVCLPSGSCAAPVDVSAADTAGETALGDTTLATASEATEASAEGVTETSNSCLPGHDGTITRAEVPVAPGLQATFLVAQHASFDTRGVSGGEPRWDLAQSFAGETKLLIETLDPAASWFGADFPTATYATKLTADSDLIGVFRVTDDGLYLLGVVSPEGGLLKTELRYTPPAKLLAYPLTVGVSWTSTSTVSGLTSGVATLATEGYRGAVDARGTVATPFADFDALRVVLHLDRWVGAAYYTEVSQVFVTECFGTIATLRSDAYETGDEFTSEAELRRLSP